MAGDDFNCYEFGEFRLDARRRSLSKSGEKVPVSARNFDLLLFMVENGGRILEHDELLDKVWAGTFVEQATLKKGVSALRQILAEKPETEFIKTIPRRGYSFVSPVRLVPADAEVFILRETEQEIIVEEYEETDDNGTGVQGQVHLGSSAAPAIALPAASTKTRAFPRWPIFAGAGIVVLVMAFFGLRPYLNRGGRQEFTAENVRISRITNSGRVTSGTVVSPDGSYILFPTAEKDGVVLWLRQVLTNSATKLTSPAKGSFWAFAIAPDNSYVYYIFNNLAEPQKSGLYKVPLLGGEPERILEDVSSMSISPDGNRIALVRLGASTIIFTVNTKGEDQRTITTFPAGFRLWSVGWAPDGSALLCALRETVQDKMLYYVAEIALETGKQTMILPAQERVVFGAFWLPDKSGLLLVAREPNADIRQIWQYSPASGEWRRVTNDSDSYQFVSLTRDGKTIVSTQGSNPSAIWLADGSWPPPDRPESKTPLIKRDNFRQITDGVSNFDKPGWMADGRLMYLAIENAKESVYTINPDGSGVRQITGGDDGIWILPTVTGNGQNICFVSSRTGVKQVWRIDADGKNLTKMTDTASPVISARILRDNATVIYSVVQAGNAVIFKQSPDGQTKQLTDSDTGFWTTSPDEKLLAAETEDKNTGQYHVELRSLDDGKLDKTFDFQPARQISFTPDGKYLAYDMTSAELSQIMLQPIEGGEPFALTDFQTDVIFGFAWSPDGSRLAVVRGKVLNDAVLIRSDDH